MFEKVKEEKGLRKLNKIGRELVQETIELPSITEVVQGTGELKTRLAGEGRVNPSYAKNTIIGLNYAETHFNSKGGSLLDNINNNNKIYPASYC